MMLRFVSTRCFISILLTQRSSHVGGIVARPTSSHKKIQCGDGGGGVGAVGVHHRTRGPSIDQCFVCCHNLLKESQKKMCALIFSFTHLPHQGRREPPSARANNTLRVARLVIAPTLSHPDERVALCTDDVCSECTAKRVQQTDGRRGFHSHCAVPFWSDIQHKRERWDEGGKKGDNAMPT